MKDFGVQSIIAHRKAKIEDQDKVYKASKLLTSLQALRLCTPYLGLQSSFAFHWATGLWTSKSFVVWSPALHLQRACRPHGLKRTLPQIRCNAFDFLSGHFIVLVIWAFSHIAMMHSTWWMFNVISCMHLFWCKVPILSQTRGQKTVGDKLSQISV